MNIKNNDTYVTLKLKHFVYRPKKISLLIFERPDTVYHFRKRLSP